MAGLSLSVAIGDYDRNRPLIDGRVAIDGVAPIFMTLSPEEIFFRAMRDEAFDICELSLASYTVRRDRGDCPYIGVPAFVSRAFRHTSIIVRDGCGIEEPKDLEGRKVGLAEWQLTANVWARMLLDDAGADCRHIQWVRGGIEEPGRLEKVALTLPPEISITDIEPHQTLKEMLSNGEIDAFMGPRLPTSFNRENKKLRWLFRDPTAEATRYFERTRIFPIMHVIGIRQTIVDQHPWLPMAILKAFELSKRTALAHLADNSAAKTTLPFLEERLLQARELMGDDFWSYGVGPNRHVLEAFLAAHHAQGMSRRVLSVDELFHPSTYQTVKV